MPKIVDHESRRRDFIEAAYTTILEEGFANTTVRAIAKKAGYTTGALLHYFGDKDKLIRQALDHFGKEMRARMELAHRDATGRQALRRILLEALPTDRRSGASWRVWLALWYHSERTDDMRQEQKRRYKEWLGRVGEVLKESVALGELPPTIDAAAEARSLVAFIDGLGVQYLMASGNLSGKRLQKLLDGYLSRLYGGGG